MPALCNARRQHFREGLHAYGTLYITSIDHVEDDLVYIFPLYVLMWIIEVEGVVILAVISCCSWLISHDEFECWLHTVILCRAVILMLGSTSFPLRAFFSSIRVVILSIFLIIVIRKTKKKVGLRCCWAPLRDLFFHHLEIIIVEIRGIVIISSRLSGFECCLSLSDPGVLDLHAMCLRQLLLLMLHVVIFPSFYPLQFLLLNE